ncbi:MAG: peptidoglycan synthetase [Flavobacteriales bacterium]|nr:peptidoglycan synthetase [Flavobacteriales bacterium]
MRIHFISIGGAVMHNMALALHQMGNVVTGSDDEIFEPALSRLKSKGLLPETFGWDKNNISKELDFIILGMHARADNPELLLAKELDIKIYSFPEYIYEHSKDKTRIVIGGSHGKTSTTAIVMHALKAANVDFDYLVGSQLEGFETMVKLSHAPYIIIEGDEYLTSALDLKPKFHWYKPHIAVLTGIAWDHINVFPTFEIYLEQFRIFIESIVPGGKLFYCKEDDELSKMVKILNCNSISYGVPEFYIEDATTYVKTNGVPHKLQVFGRHNLQNLEAGRLVCNELGIDENEYYTYMQTFKGAARRLEKVWDEKGIKVYRDFAHSPSKLKATVKAALEQFKGFKIIGVFELHTFSSLNASFLDEYEDSMNGLDLAVVYFNEHVFELKKMEVLSPELVKLKFGKVKVLTQTEALTDFLRKEVLENSVLLLMSSGNFDGLKLESFLK